MPAHGLFQAVKAEVMSVFLTRFVRGKGQQVFVIIKRPENQSDVILRSRGFAFLCKIIK